MTGAKKTKGQAAIETLVILSVSLIILMAIFFSAQDRLSSADRTLWESQARTSLDKLSDAADFVFAQSTGASTEVYITVPPNVVDINVEGHSFEFVTKAQGTNSSLTVITTPKVIGKITKSPGSRNVILKNEGVYVSVVSEDEA